MLLSEPDLKEYSHNVHSIITGINNWTELNMKKKTKTTKVNSPTRWKKFIRNRIFPWLPSVVIAIAAVVLNFIPVREEVLIQFKANAFYFQLNLNENTRIEFIKAIEVTRVGFLNTEPIKIGFTTLSYQKPDGSIKQIRENDVAEFVPQFNRYSEFGITGERMKIGLLEIGRNAVVCLELRDKFSISKLNLTIRNYPSPISMQISGDLLKLLADRYILYFSDQQQFGTADDVCQKTYLIQPMEDVSNIKVRGMDNEIIMNFDLPDSLADKTRIFEIPPAGMPFINIGFDDLKTAPLDGLKIMNAWCTELHVAGKLRKEYNGKLFFNAEDLKEFRIDDIKLKNGEAGNIIVQLKALTNKLRIGLTEKRLRNIIPSCLEYLASSKWAIVLVFIGWLFTTTLVMFEKVPFLRRKK